MKTNKRMIAIPVVAYNGIDSVVSEHFGKSPGFIVTDIQGRELTYLTTAKVLAVLRDGQSPDFPDSALCAHHSHHPETDGTCTRTENASC